VAASDPITVTPPAAEPVTLATAKLHLQVEHAVDDPLIVGLIAAARLKVEGATSRRLVRQTVRATWDRFPPFDGPGRSTRLAETADAALRLAGGECAGVDAVTYFDAAGDERTLAAGADYLTHLARVPALVYPAPGTVWPVTHFARLGCVSVVYRVGYATAADVPQDLVYAVLETVAHQYRLRGDAKDHAPDGLPQSVRWVIDHYRLPEYR
jgi:uncharacterized phiE125 gp8 family phage protein